MLRPSINQLMKPGENYYELVVTIAQKAREIAADAEEHKIPLEMKPVNLAVEYYANHQKMPESFLSDYIDNTKE